MLSCISKIESYFLREQFRPSFIGIFLNPFYFARKAIYYNIKFYSGFIKGFTLDVGCGSKPYEHLFLTDRYVGMDVRISGHNNAKSNVDIYYDGITFPFNDSYFDSIVCFEVLNHVFDPDVLLREANRVIKPGGFVLFTVPFLWDECEQPYDYARYSSFALKYLFEKNGFEIVKNRKYLADLRILTLLTNAYIFKVIRKLIPNKLSYLLILPLAAVFNIFGFILWLFPKNEDLYFGNIFLIRKIK